jgi:hypothetical protein
MSDNDRMSLGLASQSEFSEQLTRLHEFGHALEHRTQHQAMLTTESPPTTPTRDNADLCSARWGAWNCESNFWLHLYEAYTAQTSGHTHMGGRSWADEGVES